MNRLHCLAVTHRTARLALREQLAAAAAAEPQLLGRLRPAAREAVLLSTCGRFELYLVSAAARPVRPLLLAALTGVPPNTLRHAVRTYRGDAAVCQLFTVAAGLDSPVPGEPHVLGQVRAAFLAARQHGTVGPQLDALFRAAIHAGRRVRSATSLAACALSYADLAARDVLNAVGPAGRILIIGAGTLAREVAASLQGAGAHRLTFASRHAARAEALAVEFGGRASSFELLGAGLADSEAIIACTAAPAPLLGAALLAAVSHPLHVLDLGLPRNVDPAAAALPHVRLRTLDTLTGGAPLVPPVIAAEVQEILVQEQQRLLRWSQARTSAAARPQEYAA